MFALPSRANAKGRTNDKKKKTNKNKRNKKKTGNLNHGSKRVTKSHTASATAHRNGSRSTDSSSNAKHKMKQLKNVLKRKRKYQPKGNLDSDTTSKAASSTKDQTSRVLDVCSRKRRRSPASSLLQQRFSAKLKGAQFRWLNEKLYTTAGKQSYEMFQQDPDLFHAYHRGFREQASTWRVNPLDVIICDLQNRPDKCVIADFGCGEARLAATLNQRHTVHSFDLVAGNNLITACDIANVPLSDSSVDVAVFCLALMGVNYVDFLQEAHRTLKPGALLKIAEVESRFIHGSDLASRDAGIRLFTRTLGLLGFRRTSIDSSNEFFIMFEFVKDAQRSGQNVRSLRREDIFELKACRYKKR